MSQEALATDSGIGRAYVSSLERGQKNPTVRLLERVSVALDADIGELFVRPKPGDPMPKVLNKGRPRKR